MIVYEVFTDLDRFATGMEGSETTQILSRTKCSTSAGDDNAAYSFILRSGFNNVAQDAILDFLIRRLRDAVLCGGQRDKCVEPRRSRL